MALVMAENLGGANIMNQKIKIAAANCKTDKNITIRNRTGTTSLAEIGRQSARPKRLKNIQNCRKQRDERKDHGGFVGGWLKGGSRKNGNVISRMVGMLDADSILDSTEFLQSTRSADRSDLFIYSTHSHARSPKIPGGYPFLPMSAKMNTSALMRMVAQNKLGWII